MAEIGDGPSDMLALSQLLDEGASAPCLGLFGNFGLRLGEGESCSPAFAGVCLVAFDSCSEGLTPSGKQEPLLPVVAAPEEKKDVPGTSQLMISP